MLLLCLQLLMTQVVLAHASLLTAEPASNTQLEKTPDRITIRFTEPLEARFSEIQVLNAQGQSVDNGDSSTDKADPTSMSVTLRSLPNGTYTVAWTSVSSVDGHIINGSYLFSVGEPISGTIEPPPPPPLVQSPAEPVLVWLFIVGILAVVGGLIFELIVWRPVLTRQGASEALQRVSSLLTTRTRRVTWLAMAVFLVASVGQLLIRTAILDRPLFTVLTQTSWGDYWIWRMALFVLVAGFLGASALFSRQSARFKLSLNVLALVAAGGVLLTLSLVSHAAGTSGIRFAAVFSDYIHLLAAGFWVGSLFHFAAVMPLLLKNLPSEERGMALSAIVHRFSPMAVLSVGTLVVTGIYSSWAQVTIVSAVGAPYGLTLLAKLALIGPLLLLGGLNSAWVGRRLSNEVKAGQWLRRFVTGEAVLATIVLLSVGWLISMEPARQVFSRQESEKGQILTFQETSEGTDITLEITPGRVGPNKLIVLLKDSQGNPINNAADIIVRLIYVKTGIDSIETAEFDSEGKYVVPNVPLSIAGQWQVGLTVIRPDAFSARVGFPFEVASGATSVAIVPLPNIGKLLFGVELLLLGFLFLAIGFPLRGWWASIMAPGAVAVLVGLFLVAGVQLTKTQTPTSNPFPANPQSLETGKRVYTQSCQECHGVSGRGDGPRAAALNPKPLDLTVQVPLHIDSHLYGFISDGLPNTAMVAWGKTLTTEQIWHLVNYLRSLVPQGP